MAQLVKNPSIVWETWVRSWVGKIPWRRERLPTPVFLPGESHGQRSLVGYSPWGQKESDRTERLTHALDTFIWLPAYHQFASYNYHQVTQLSFLLVVITFKICSLSNFQVHSTMLTIITMLYIRSLERIHLGILYLWMKPPHLPHTQPVGTNILPSYILLSNQSGNTNDHFKIEGC